MSYIPKPGTGSLFENDHKKADNHPDRKGSLNINGTVYEIAGWLRQTKNGKPWLSLSVKPVEQRQEPVQPKPVTGTIADMKDDVPW